MKTRPMNRYLLRIARLLRAASALAVASVALPALAAGGHHAIDDAALLDPGHCKLESWASRSGPGPLGLLHGAVGCRLGPIEWSLGADQARVDGTRQRTLGAQLKWATALTPWLSGGLAVAPAWTPTVRPRERSVVVNGLLTGTWSEDLRWHANLGRTQADPGGARAWRGGLSVDWAFRPDWQVMTERYREDGSDFLRSGLRWQPAQGWTLDASHAWRLRGEGKTASTLGLTFEFE